MNLPNAITLSRLVVTVACIACLELAGDVRAPSRVLVWWAFGLFLFAAITDFVDGYLARRYGQVTSFGRIADPMVDKILIAGTLIVLLRFPAAREYLPSWVVVVVIARELLVTTLRAAAEAAGRSFPAERLGKWKMVAQCVVAAALLTVVAGAELWIVVADWGMWIMLALTVASGAGYVWRAREFVKLG